MSFRKRVAVADAPLPVVVREPTMHNAFIRGLLQELPESIGDPFPAEKRAAWLALAEKVFENFYTLDDAR